MTTSTIETKRDARPGVLLLGLAIACAVYFLAGKLPFPEDVSSYRARMAAAVTALTATCWLGNAMGVGMASLIPLALLPLLGVLPVAKSATAYSHPILWLFFGGFVLALGVERWGLHRRIALRIISILGVKPNRLILGFMVAGAFLSMWLSNTATTLLLFPIAMAMVQNLRRADVVDARSERNFGFVLLLGIAFGCSVGGIGTPIGTSPNALFLSTYSGFVDKGAPAIGFLQWMIIALPVTLLMVPLIWLFLTRMVSRVPEGNSESKKMLDREVRALPPMTSAEFRMAGLFVLAALLWTTRQDFQLSEGFTFPGWWRLLPVETPKDIGDGAVAVFISVIAFVVPSGLKKGQALMNWEHAVKMPWDILLLLGGGILIARSFQESGLSDSIGLAMRPVVEDLHPLVMIFFVCSLVTFFTEVTSNTAMVSLFLPILMSVALAGNIDPRLLMIPATFSASCAFMLPIATPPNAIVYASGMIPMARMARVGFVINLMGIVVVTLVTWFVAVIVLGVQTSGAPEWAN